MEARGAAAVQRTHHPRPELEALLLGVVLRAHVRVAVRREENLEHVEVGLPLRQLGLGL